MIDAFSTRSNRIKTLILLAACCLAAIAATIVGIDDNPSGILFAMLAATAFVLAFTHPWRTARKFLFLLLASVIGLVLFITLSVASDILIIQDPASPAALRNLIENPVYEALNLVFAMLCTAALLVGIVGSVASFIRNRIRKP